MRRIIEARRRCRLASNLPGGGRRVPSRDSSDNGSWTSCTRNVSWTGRRQKSTRRFWTKESTCVRSAPCRILSDAEEVRDRRNQVRHPNYRKPEFLATGPNQVWSWDITKLLGPAKWTYFYLYIFLDIFSRYVVGWMIASRESADLARRLIRETVEKQGVLENQLIIHSDRGPSMKSHGVAQLLGALGITKSHSRPHVSNDNPFSESQFKTLKYRPDFPSRFGSQQDAHEFCRAFFKWYNDEHYHSGIGLLTPTSVHYGHANRILEKRQTVLHAAYARHPERFVNKSPSHLEQPSSVWINPPRLADEVSHKNDPPVVEIQVPSGLKGQETELEISRLTSAELSARLQMTPSPKIDPC